MIYATIVEPGGTVSRSRGCTGRSPTSEPSFEQREQDAAELAWQAIGRYVAELTILGEGQDPIRFATEVLCGAITAAIFIESAAPPRSTAEQMLALLRSVPRGQSQN
jgi:hypothetical protein